MAALGRKTCRQWAPWLWPPSGHGVDSSADLAVGLDPKRFQEILIEKSADFSSFQPFFHLFAMFPSFAVVFHEISGFLAPNVPRFGIIPAWCA